MAAGLGILFTISLTGCKPQAFTMPPRPPSPVTVSVAETRDVPVYLDEIGRTVPSELVNIQAQVTGQVMERHFEDGADLKKGDPLFVIDKRTYQAAVAQAEANLEHAKALLELAQAEFKRYESAYKVGAANREDFDTKKANLDTATAQVKVAQAALDTAKLNLSFCTIDSPIDGRAGQRLVDVGNLVKANDAQMLTIQRITPIYVDFTVAETDLPRVRNELEKGTLHTLVSLPQTPNETREGPLTFLDTNVQQGAGRITLRATLKNTDRYFWPGQFVNVRLVMATIKNAVLVPFECLQQGQQGQFVYVLKEDSTVEQRPVVRGQRQQVDGHDLVVIQQGVKSGEKVVRTGQLAIGPGAKVNVVAEPEVPASAAPGADEASTQPATQEGAAK